MRRLDAMTDGSSDTSVDPAAPGASAPPCLREGELEALEGVLLDFSARSGLEADPILVHKAVERAHLEADDLGGWVSQVRLAGKDLGLRLTPIAWSLREAIGHATRTHPVALRAATPSSREAWALVLQGGWWRVRVRFRASGEERSVSYGDLAEALGVPSLSDSVEALTFQSLTSWEGPPVHGGHGAGHAQGLTPTARLVRLMRPERADLWTIFLFSAATGVLALATPLAVDALVSFVAFGGVYQPLVALGAVLLVCLALSAGMRALQFYVAEVIQRRLFLRMASDLAYRLPRVRRDAFDQQHSPEMVNRFFAISTLQKTASTILLDGINVVLSATIGMVILGFYHPILLGFDVFLIAAVAFVLFVLGRGAVGTSIEDSESMYSAAGWLEELGRFPVAFKPPLAAEMAIDRADRATSLYIAARTRHFRILMRQTVGALLLQAFGSTLLLGLGGWLVIDGQLTLGQLVASELIVTVVLGSISKLSKQLEAWYDILAAVDKLGHLIDLPLEREGGESKVIRSDGASIGAHDLVFAYGEGRPVIDGATLQVAPGEKVGFDDAEGSGHTTLLEILYGLRDPRRGHVAIDGMDLRHWRLDALRDQIAFVHHDELVKGTIDENVRMGREHLRHADVKAALEAVGLWDEVLALPEGVHTLLTSGGAPLSATARLRLALARALVGRPRVLLLDGILDRLSAADREKAIRAVFHGSQRWTVVVVTQSPSVLAQCDRVYGLVKGRLVEGVVRKEASRA